MTTDASDPSDIVLLQFIKVRADCINCQHAPAGPLGDPDVKYAVMEDVELDPSAGPSPGDGGAPYFDYSECDFWHFPSECICTRGYFRADGTIKAVSLAALIAATGSGEDPRETWASGDYPTIQLSTCNCAGLGGATSGGFRHLYFADSRPPAWWNTIPTIAETTRSAQFYWNCCPRFSGGPCRETPTGVNCTRNQ